MLQTQTNSERNSDRYIIIIIIIIIITIITIDCLRRTFNTWYYQMSLSILPLPTANYKSSGNLIRFGYVGHIWEA